MDFITHPLPNIEAWIRHLTNQRIPVLGRTAAQWHGEVLSGYPVRLKPSKPPS
jgi:hypothetical protein